MTKDRKIRPKAVTALSIFFLAGAILSFTASAALLAPNSFLGVMWRLNPRAHESLLLIGLWAVALLLVVSVSCAAAAIGLWRGARWGHTIATALIEINLVGDVLNTFTGQPRAIVGIPIAGAILWYLWSQTGRRFFGK